MRHGICFYPSINKELKQTATSRQTNTRDRMKALGVQKYHIDRDFYTFFSFLEIWASMYVQAEKSFGGNLKSQFGLLCNQHGGGRARHSDWHKIVL